MNFWIFAIALLLIPAAVISWPLFSGPARDRFTGLFLLLIIPLAGLLMYLEVGTPDALDQRITTPQQAAQPDQPHSTQGQMQDMIANLQQRMNENPDDPEGWLILGRSLKTLQRYAEAETAMSNAFRLLPDNPMVMVELAEARLFASGLPEFSDEDRELLEAAVERDPGLQKGLWLLGIAASQQGDDGQAIEVWHSLLTQLDPNSEAAARVSEQIAQAQARLGESTAPSSLDLAAGAAPVAAEEAVFGINVNVALADELDGVMPAQATLFVFIQPAGARGMPLAVKRGPVAGFPLSLRFTDADLLQPGASLEDFDTLDLSARISMSGIANRASGDLQSDIVTIETNSREPIALNIDQRVP